MFFPGALIALAAQWFSRVEVSYMWRTFEPRPWTLRIVALRHSPVRAQFFQDGERRISRLDLCWSEILSATKIQTPSGPSSAGRLGSCTTVAKPLPLSRLGLPLSEKQIPQVVENLESGGKPKETLERVAMRPRQVRYPASRFKSSQRRSCRSSRRSQRCGAGQDVRVQTEWLLCR